MCACVGCIIEMTPVYVAVVLKGPCKDNADPSVGGFRVVA